MKRIVFYYSKNGNNKYLAIKTAEKLDCEIEEIKPKFCLLSRLISNNIRLKKNKLDITDYDLVILFGPARNGNLLPPVKSFINKYYSRINKMIFATCCLSDFCEKDGHNGFCKVFAEVEHIAHDKCLYYEAFPLPLLFNDIQKNNKELLMSTRLSENNFKGGIAELFNDFIKKINSF
jgi:flavodoxin